MDEIVLAAKNREIFFKKDIGPEGPLLLKWFNFKLSMGK